MTTYRLPDGTEGTHVRESTDYEEKLWVIHSQLGLILIDRDKLTEVEPEPSDGAFALVEIDDGQVVKREVFERQIGSWWQVGDNRIGHDWDALRLRGNVTVLVPDPADDAPELPFKIWISGERSVIVEPSGAYADRLFVEVDSAHLVRKDVFQLAAALWAWAAREVEKP